MNRKDEIKRLKNKFNNDDTIFFLLYTSSVHFYFNTYCNLLMAVDFISRLGPRFVSN